MGMDEKGHALHTGTPGGGLFPPYVFGVGGGEGGGGDDCYRGRWILLDNNNRVPTESRSLKYMTLYDLI